MSSKYTHFLGLDGGGTGCRAMLVDAAGQELSRAEGGAANVATDMDDAINNIKNLIDTLFAQANVSSSFMSSTSAVLGLAGANVVKSNAPVEQALPCAEVYVTDDREVVVEGALGGANGGIAAPGTGSFFACRAKDELRSLGGWGFMLGDEASGAWLGRKLLTLTIHCHDGVTEHSDITRKTLKKFNGEPSRMVQFANEATPKDFGSDARDIVAHALDGDVHAKRLMQDGADWIETALTTLGFSHGDRLCLWGGLGPQYLPYLTESFAAGYAEPVSDALRGAVSVARKRAGQFV